MIQIWMRLCLWMRMMLWMRICVQRGLYYARRTVKTQNLCKESVTLAGRDGASTGGDGGSVVEHKCECITPDWLWLPWLERGLDYNTCSNPLDAGVSFRWQAWWWWWRDMIWRDVIWRDMIWRDMRSVWFCMLAPVWNGGLSVISIWPVWLCSVFEKSNYVFIIQLGSEMIQCRICLNSIWLVWLFSAWVVVSLECLLLTLEKGVERGGWKAASCMVRAVL